MAATPDSPKNPLGIKDDIFRLFASQLLCYLLAIVYNTILVKRSVQIKHLFSLTFGLLICYFNFGIETAHSVATIFVSWTIIQLLGPTGLMVVVNFSFTMAYMMYGYFMKEVASDTTFNWTLGQCVLTLSLIAMSFDIYDGHKNSVAKASGGPLTNEDTALETVPTLLEVFAKTYFPPAFLIGPQVRFKDYLRFTESSENLLPFCWKQSVIRFLIGIVYFGVYTLGHTFLDSNYFLSDQFSSHGLFAKLCLLAFFNKIVLCKYVSGWAIAEGSCIMYGISRDPDSGQINRCFNMNITLYETTATFGGLIESFNMTTNFFALRYVFKRLKFLNSKLLSQFATLFFLAVWHGFSLGYYNTFALEMVIMKMEKDIASIVVKLRTRKPWVNQLLNNPTARCLIYLAMRLHVILMFSYAFTSFGFLEFRQWSAILAQLYYCGHFIYFPWLLLSMFVRF